MRRLALLTLLVVAPLVSGHAQEDSAKKRTPDREGFYIGFGVGPGSVMYFGDFTAVETNKGFSGHLRMGGTPGRQWLLGGEMDGWMKGEDGIDSRYGALLGIATFYPSRTNDLFFEGGLGIATYNERSSSDKLTATGPAWSLGFGWDIRVRQKFGAVVVLHYVVGNNWNVKLNGSDTGRNLGIGVIQTGIGVIWH